MGKSTSRAPAHMHDMAHSGAWGAEHAGQAPSLEQGHDASKCPLCGAHLRIESLRVSRDKGVTFREQRRIRCLRTASANRKRCPLRIETQGEAERLVEEGRGFND